MAHPIAEKVGIIMPGSPEFNALNPDEQKNLKRLHNRRVNVGDLAPTFAAVREDIIAMGGRVERCNVSVIKQAIGMQAVWRALEEAGIVSEERLQELYDEEAEKMEEAMKAARGDMHAEGDPPTTPNSPAAEGAQNEAEASGEVQRLDEPTTVESDETMERRSADGPARLDG